MKLNLKIVFGWFMISVFLVSFLSLPGFVEAKGETTVTVEGYLYSLAVSPDGKYVYVPNGKDVAVLDTSTNKLLTPIKAGNNPQGVAVSPDGAYIYVLNRDVSSTGETYMSSDGNTTPIVVSDGSVSVISTATNKVTATVKVSDPTNLAVSPDGAYIYVLNNKVSSDVTSGGGGEVLTINTATNSVSSTLSIVGIPLDVAVSPDGKYVYVTQGTGFVSVIDTTTNAVTTRISVGGGIYNVVVSPDGAYLYVSGIETVYVVNTKSNAVATTISGFGSLGGVAVSPNGKYVYVTDRPNKLASVINTDTNRIEYSVNVGTDPTGIVISPNGKYVYVANNEYVPKKDAEFGVDYVGTISIVSADPNALGTISPSRDPNAESPNVEVDNNGSQNPDGTTPNVSTPASSFPIDPIQLLIIVLGAVVIVGILLTVLHSRRGSTKTRLSNSDVKNKTITEECELNSSQINLFV